MQKKYFIDNLALKRLLDPTVDIRLRSLRELTAILKNNIIFAAKETEGSDDDLTVVSLDTLVRNLILWFRFRPVTNEAEVLDLLILILSRRNLLRHIAKNISITRLAKEFNKIKNLVLAGESYIKLHTILQLLEDYRSSVLIDVANISGSFGDIEGVSFGESTKYSFMSSGPEVDLIERMKKLQHTSPGQTSSVGSKCDEKEEVLVDFWEELNGVSLDTFNALEAELSLYKEDNHLSTVLKFLRSSADDYPPEFFLQPPHILESLTDILYKVSKNESIQIVKQIRFIVNSLKDRWMDSLACLKKKDQKFVSVKKHINHVIRIVNNYFATFHDNFNINFFVDNQNVLNEIYLLLNDIAVFVKETQNVCEIFVNELLNMMAKVSKDFRLSYPDAQLNKSTVRLHYMILIYTINVLAASIDTKDVRNYCDNNIWEFESDVALLDAPLRIGSSEVYAIIKKNRKKVIKEDKDLMLLLNIKSCWKPVVELFQNWNSLTAREIILKGSEAIDTIRIHKSLEVVDLLLRIIVSSSKMLSNDKKLKEAAEDIYLRLLSIEVIEIRERAYRAVRDSVQMKIKYGSDDLKGENICSVIGFPVSPEIVTEILCFGFTDSCKSIQEQAKLILFTLLRAKVIYAGYWEELLNIIKPILPLMSCLFSLDENMGIINFDVFNQHSGFDENELNQAYARFLYSKNQKARVMAKEKLLSSLNIPSDLINVVPDDFCLLPKALVSDIQMPESSVKYDKEAYEETIAILKEIDRTNIEIVQSIIINLSVMMNSRECCQKSHDDNLWVFFLTQLDMRAPNNEIIRKVTVNILHKWAVSVPSFRIYLANEPKVLEFLVNTLIYFQEDARIKQQTSSLLFLLLFCDFVVTTERSVSMPQFLESMSCPFKFQHHWTESPFNKITALEQLQEMMEAGNDQTNIQQISQRYMKFTFAEVWFNGHIKLAPESSTSTFYYTNRAVKPFTIIKDLMLSDEDVGLMTQSSSNEILKNLSSQLDNTTTVQNALSLTFHVQSLLTMPLTCVEGIADSIDKKIERFIGFTSVNDMQQLLFVKVMEIYQRIVKMLTDQKILNLLKTQFFVDLITTDATFNDEVFVASLSLLNCIVKQCRGRPSLMKLLIETYEKKHQVYLPSKIVEKLWNYLTSGVMTDVRKWKEIDNRLAVKVALMVIRNVLSIMPIRLNDTFLTNVMFCFLLDKMRQLYCHQMHHVKASTPLHVHSGMMKQVFGICLTIASHVKRLPMKQSTYISLLFWVAEEQRKHKALPWMIIAELTKNKEDFESFCKGFESAMGVQFICTVSSALLDCKTPSNLTFLDQKAIVSVIANILDHDVTPSLCGFNLSALQLMLAKLAELNNVSAFGFLVRKMIQSKTTATDCLVLTFDLIRKFLDYEVPADVCAPTYQKIADQFESAVCCYQYEPLKAFVEGLVVNELDLGFIQMFVDTQEKPEPELKKFNHNGFNLLLILIQSDAGMVRLCSALNEPRNIDRMIYASHDGLRTANPPSELIFQLGFWCSVLHSCEKFESPLMDVISTNLLDLSSGRCMFIKKTDENGNLRNDSILEREFNSVRYSIDLLFLQVASIFEFVYSSKLSAEYKHDIKALCFLIISKLTDNNERVRQLSKETNLAGLVMEKLSLQLSTMQSFRYLETTKKIGAQKSQFMIKDLAIFLKALTEWKLPLASNAKSMRKIFDQLLKVYDWIDADSLLKNCFLNLIQAMSALDVGKSCLLHEIEGKPLLKTILKKTQALSVKPPHTETNLALIKNGIATLTTCSRFVEVRIMLKNCKVFEMLECLHPQIQNNRKSSWDRVTIEWLKFFEFLSKYDDTECLPNHVSLLCRMFRLGNSAIKRLSLVIIRNFSTKGPIGSILLNSEDFKQTANAILSDSTDADEKSLILQTLLSIASKGEQSKAKLKNSSLNRKLKDQLAVMQSDSKFQGKPENQIILNLTTMLNNVLYFKESC